MPDTKRVPVMSIHRSKLLRIILGAMHLSAISRRQRRSHLKQFSQGADIIYHAAGGSGLGVFQAAKEKNFYANRRKFEPEHS